MGEKHYDVTFTVRGDKLTTIIEALRGEYMHMNITEVTPVAKAVQRHGNGHHLRPGRDPVRSVQWALLYKDMLFKLMERGREYHVFDPQLVNHFVGQGKDQAFAGNLLSALYRAGALQRMRRGIYMRKD